MAKQKKKKIRQNFREAVFARDGGRCCFCPITEKLDDHHITDRNEMPNGGYVKENGIYVCHSHHMMAEVFHSTGVALPGFSPEDLYKAIGSSYEEAVKASERLRV